MGRRRKKQEDNVCLDSSCRSCRQKVRQHPNICIVLLLSLIVVLQLTLGKKILDRNSYGNVMRRRRSYAALHSDFQLILPSSCVPIKWSNECFSAECGMYDVVANIVTLLSIDHGICALLDSGSLLGAHRHFGIMEWDKDTDFAVFSTNLTAIESVLDGLMLKWKYVGREEDGNKGRGRGFGYHVFTSYHQYIDLWLWSSVSSEQVGCVGINNGCEYWYLANWKQQPPTYDNELYSDAVLLPFGQWLMPGPVGGEKILDIKYGNNWRHKCGGWQRGDRPCSRLHETHAFVFDEENDAGEDSRRITKKKILRKGNKVLAKFSRNDKGAYEVIQ